MPRNLRGAVVVITGASSGIGRATAHAFAQRGANVVVTARREALLQEVAAECTRMGVGAMAVPTDVRDEAALHDLARRTLERFGGIDVWINNAGVSLLAPFEESPPDLYREVIETDLFGTIHGTRAALPIFRQQGRGVLINTASMVSRVPQPYASAYVIAKRGVAALGECLRQELALSSAKNIHVCTVMPAAIDTPFFQHAADYTGLAIKPPPPVYDPEQVAAAMVRLAQRPRREVFVGNAARLANLQYALMPAPAERMLATFMDRMHLDHSRPVAPNDGNVVTPVAYGNDVHGGWKAGGDGTMRRVAAALAVGVPLLLARRRTQHRDDRRMSRPRWDEPEREMTTRPNDAMMRTPYAP
jgi:short-subunit dehydrogenase